MSTYRDPANGLSEQIARQRARVDEAGEKLTPLFLAMLPEETQAEIAAARARVAECPASEPTSAAAALEALKALEALEVLIEMALRSPALVLECSDDVAPPGEVGWRGWPPNTTLVERFERLVKVRLREIVGSDFDVTPWSTGLRTYPHPPDGGRIFRFHVRGIPFLLAGNALVLRSCDEPPAQAVHRYNEAEEPSQVEGPIETYVFLRTTVPRSLRLVVRGERVHLKVGKALSFAKEVELADTEFDPKFFVQGDAAVANALLVAGVRRALLDLQACSPRLAISDGIAELAYRASYDAVTARSVLPAPPLDGLTLIREASGARPADADRRRRRQ
jgi:hypothetical protein